MRKHVELKTGVRATVSEEVFVSDLGDLESERKRIARGACEHLGSQLLTEQQIGLSRKGQLHFDQEAREIARRCPEAGCGELRVDVTALWQQAAVRAMRGCCMH